MEGKTPHDLLATAASTWPDAIALRTDSDEWTYAELDYAASEIAGRVPAGERIAFRAELTPATVAAVWGVPRGGGIAVPIDPGLDVTAAAELSASLGATMGWPEHIDQIRSERDPVPDAPALVVATSGSSGASRGVILTFGNIVSAAFASQLHLGSRRGDVWLLAMPLHHVAGLAILWRAAHDGATVHLQRGFAAEPFAAALAGDVVWTSVVPTMLRRLLAARLDAPRLRGMLVGGAHVPSDLLAEALSRGIPALATYGMTETCSQASTVLPGQEAASVGTVGFPLPGVAVAVDAAPGEIGPISISGSTVATGYVDQPSRSGPLQTNDLGYFDAAGRLVIVGRSDEVIISGGENIYPQVVERALCFVAGVSDAVVFGVADDEWGQRVVAVVEGTGIDEDSVLGAVEGIPQYAKPKQLRVVESLPLLPNGKIDRNGAKDAF
ncbi:MAG: acyl--CoA ligase [Acidimicrobiia bacterium]|nr:acyl--CoA ligase [Acidimicrobiia bacterium]